MEPGFKPPAAISPEKLNALAAQYDPFPVLREMEQSAGNPAGGMQPGQAQLPYSSMAAPGQAPQMPQLPVGPSPQYMQQMMGQMAAPAGYGGAPSAGLRQQQQIALAAPRAPAPVMPQRSLGAIINGGK